MNSVNPFKMIKNLGDKLGDMIGDEKESESETSDEENVTKLDDKSQYNNPLMRGFVKLHNLLEQKSFEEHAISPIEFTIKVKMLDILEIFLDKRHQFLIQNIVEFFRQNVIMYTPFESDEEKTVGNKDIYIVKRVIKNYHKGFLPNILYTGIQDLDEPKIENINDPFKALMSLKKNLDKMIAAEYPEFFTNYVKDLFESVLDPDQYLSAANGDDNLNNE